MKYKRTGEVIRSTPVVAGKAGRGSNKTGGMAQDDGKISGTVLMVDKLVETFDANRESPIRTTAILAWGLYNPTEGETTATERTGRTAETRSEATVDKVAVH